MFDGTPVRNQRGGERRLCCVLMRDQNGINGLGQDVLKTVKRQLDNLTAPGILNRRSPRRASTSSEEINLYYELETHAKELEQAIANLEAAVSGKPVAEPTQPASGSASPSGPASPSATRPPPPEGLSEKAKGKRPANSGSSMVDAIIDKFVKKLNL